MCVCQSTTDRFSVIFFMHHVVVLFAPCACARTLRVGTSNLKKTIREQLPSHAYPEIASCYTLFSNSDPTPESCHDSPEIMRRLVRSPAILTGNALRHRPGASPQFNLAVDEGAAFEVTENGCGYRWCCEAQIVRNGHVFGPAAGGGERKQDAMNQAANGAIAIYYSRTPGVDCPSEDDADNMIPIAQCINVDHPYVMLDRAFEHKVVEAIAEVQAASSESVYDRDSLHGSIEATKDIIGTLHVELEGMLTTLHMFDEDK